MNPLQLRAEKLAEDVRKEKIWEMLKAVLPHYLYVFTAEPENGLPNVHFRMAVAWATETAEHSFNTIFNTEKKTDEQEEPTETHETQSAEASTEAQAPESSEAGQVAS